LARAAAELRAEKPAVKKLSKKVGNSGERVDKRLRKR